jgi:hypothetical protein
MQGTAIGSGSGQLEGKGSGRLLYINTGKGVPGLPVLGLGEHDRVIEPGAMQFAGGLVQIDPEQYWGSAFEALWRPGYFLCVARC